ncbi:MAG: SOS response-associated peptidase [Planctomycetota bacterium]|jgi:putative SOS response-associated peptidase YedK
MCGRFTLSSPADVVAEWFSLTAVPALQPRYNIAPSQPVAAVRAGADGQSRVLNTLRWGLIPSWSKDPAIGNRMINARSETAAEKPSFRTALKKRRCLIPADGFYEWKKEGTQKQPYLIRFNDSALIGLAGLWESWTSPEGEMIESCTILTTRPNTLMKTIHDRMPVIVEPSCYGEWLSFDPLGRERMQRFFAPFPDDALDAVAVSRHVNSPAHEDIGCIAPMDR